MSDRFPSKKSRPATDRAATTRRATSGRAAPTRTPTRQDSPLIDRMARMRAGQGAVDFGRQQTSQPGVEAAINAIRSRVMQNLSSKGIYQDDRGSYQIRGMERGGDGLAIRDSAVAAMGGPDWTRIVNEADARLRGGLPGGGMPAGAPVKTATSVGGVEPAVLRKTATSVGGTEPIPQPGLGGVPGIPQRPIPTVGTGAPPITRIPGAGGTVPSPGLGGVPTSVTSRPDMIPYGKNGGMIGRSLAEIPINFPGTQPAVPSPGLGGVPQTPGYMGPEAAARQQQQTIFNASPGLGGTVFTPKEQQQNVIPAGGVWNEPSQAALGARTNVPGVGGTLPSPGLGGVYASPGGQFPPQGQGVGRTTTPTGAQVNPSQYPVTAPQPGLGGVPQIPSGTPSAPGRPSTPTVAPGSLPGNTTPMRPGQMPTTFPNGRTFGTSGQPVVSPNMGAQIRQDVASRVGGIRAQPGMPQTPTQSIVAGAALTGLGDRIRASVQRGVAGVNDQVGVGTSDLGGGLGSTIAASVRRQLQQAGVGQRPGLPGGPQAPGVPGVPTDLGASIRAQVQAQLAPSQRPPMGGVPAAGQGIAAPGAGTTPGGPVYGPVPPGSGGSADQVAQLIVQQETGGQNLTGQQNCTIRPAAGCLALNSGIFKSTADSMGLDFNRIVNDQEYANYAVGQLMTTYAQDDASKWNGPSGQSVWDYGEQNLPGGGWEAVARVYFGGDVTGQYVDEQGRSGATYGQQFVDKMQAAGIPVGPGGTPPGQAPAPSSTGAPAVDPNTGIVVTGANGGNATLPPGSPPQQPTPDPRTGVIAPPGSLTLPPAGATIQMPNASSQQIVDIARLYVNQVPYESLDIWNGNPGLGVDPRDPAQHGWDCSGMVYWLDQNYGGGNLPEGSHEQYNYLAQNGYFDDGRAAQLNGGDYSSLRVGDLIYMDSGASVRGGNNASHVAVFAGYDTDGTPLFINAANPNEGTTIWRGLYGYPVLGVATVW